jgi:hypothetical protein
MDNNKGKMDVCKKKSGIVEKFVFGKHTLKLLDFGPGMWLEW